MKGSMITAEMIAPCGLDCSLCRHALAEENPCPGCHGPEICQYTRTASAGIVTGPEKSRTGK